MGNGLLQKTGGLCVGVAVLAALACSSNKNHAEREAVATAKPDFCIDQCTPDPTPQPVDCAATEDHDTYEYIRLWDFEAPDASAATAMYIYDDGSVCEPGSGCDETVSFREPNVGYQPPVQTIARCGGQPTRAFRLWGGPFLSWGGGFGRSLKDFQCMDCPVSVSDFPGHTRDLSQWEGFSFWARRGPDGQAGIRIGIGDQSTDDDLSFLSYVNDPSKPRRCERNKECGCRSGPCTPYAHPDSPLAPIFYCWDPAIDPVPAFIPGTNDTQYDLCGQSACNAGYDAFEQPFNISPNVDANFCDANPALCESCAADSDCTGDPQFFGKSCTRFDFRGSISGDYCFDPGVDPNPYEGTDLCGDLWVKAVNLTT
jgi:hypothetical protein